MCLLFACSYPYGPVMAFVGSRLPRQPHKPPRPLPHLDSLAREEAEKLKADAAVHANKHPTPMDLQSKIESVLIRSRAGSAASGGEVPVRLPLLS